MNKHILLVKKWLADKDSVSQEELEENAVDAYDAATNEAAYAAYRAACYAAYAAAIGSGGVADYAATSAGYWIRRYKELSK
jgi:hypothetical protein